jgi:hypothetical protein
MMLKRFEELNRAEKIDLLQMVASGEISREFLNKKTTFGTKREDGFIAMLSRLNSVKENTEVNIILIGEAREAEKQAESFAKEVLEKYPVGVPVDYL